MSLRIRIFAGEVAALAAIEWIALAATTGLALGTTFAIKSAVVFSVIGVSILVFVRDHHPFMRFGLANAVTLTRAAIASLVVALIGEPTTPMVAASAVAGGGVVLLLDGVDGWLARRTRLASPFGARFDMEVDALLILALAVLVWQQDKAGLWILFAGLCRYLFVAAGAWLPWMRQPLPPSRRRQTICVVQIAGLLIALVPLVPVPLSTAVGAASLAALCASFSIDTMWLWRRREAFERAFSFA